MLAVTILAVAIVALNAGNGTVADARAGQQPWAETC